MATCRSTPRVSFRRCRATSDFQLNPANTNSFLALATVDGNFATDGSVGPVAFSARRRGGPATGSLGLLAALLFDNGSPLNELTYSFTYGTTFSFDVTLSGTALSGGAPAGASSTFVLTLLDPAGNAFSTGRW